MKVFIVDDNKIIRKGLRTIIGRTAPWCRIVGEASNGLDALDFLKENTADVLITDIKMPVLDGLGLIKKIREQDIKVKIFVLSGHDDYKFVRQSLTGGADDYLLKPVESEVLAQLLEKTRMELEQEDKQKQQLRIGEGLLNSVEMMKEKILKNLVKGNFGDTAEIKKRFVEIGILNSEVYALAVIAKDMIHDAANVYEFKHGHHINIQEKLETLAEEISTKASVLSCENEVYTIAMFLCASAEEQDAFKESLSILQTLMEAVECQFGESMTIGVSQWSNDLQRVHFLYEQAVLAYERKFYEGSGKIIIYNREKSIYGKIVERDFASYAEFLINCLEIGDSTKAARTATALIAKIEECNPSPGRFKDVIENVLSRAKITSGEFADRLEEANIQKKDIYKFLNSVDTLARIKEYLPLFAYELISTNNLIKCDKRKRFVDISIDYIKKHYTERITLKVISDLVALSPSYFSEIFKAETGKSFLDYLIEFRISEAKKKLQDPTVKVYEVGQMVGYDEPVSFNRAFKKVVGISPEEYRKIVK